MLADNPIRGMTQLLYALQAPPLDKGSEHFAPSTLEVVSVDVGNPAWNVIPASATARFNSRYNDLLDAREPAGGDRAAADSRRRADPALSQGADHAGGLGRSRRARTSSSPATKR